MDSGNVPAGMGVETSAEKRLKVWRALALVLAAIVAALAFAAYTQPELLLNYTGLRYCG